MRIWFDLSNSPHVNLYCKLIQELQGEGHDIVITCRPLSNTIELLELRSLPYKVVGKHYGANFLMKVIGYPIRVVQLYRFLRTRKPDVAVSHSSFHSPLVAFLLGIRCIYMNDNEHALGNVPAFCFASTVMVPEFLDRRKVRRQCARDSKIIQYPGLKEGLYLWHSAAGFKPNGHGTPRPTVFVRPEPWNAQYYSGPLNFLDDFLVELSAHARVVLSPRGKVQLDHYLHPKFSQVEVLRKPMDLMDIARSCSLFIGAGGTMSREFAILGIPTISIYQDELLDVDKYLIAKGLMVHLAKIDVPRVLELLAGRAHLAPLPDLLNKGRQAYTLLKHIILNDSRNGFATPL